MWVSNTKTAVRLTIERLSLTPATVQSIDSFSGNRFKTHTNESDWIGFEPNIKRPSSVDQLSPRSSSFHTFGIILRKTPRGIQ